MPMPMPMLPMPMLHTHNMDRTYATVMVNTKLRIPTEERTALIIRKCIPLWLLFRGPTR